MRVGGHVLRPSNPHTSTIHSFLRFLRAEGFDGASAPVGIEPDGRERLEFIAGDVAVPPYPAWAQTDAALASAARLLRRFHEFSARYVVGPDATWSTEMADPDASTVDPSELVVCHNDVCLENLVYRDGEAVGLLDFDFAAPGRRLHDLATFARMNVPMDADDDAVLLGRTPPFDPFRRLRVVADAYGLPPDRRRAARRPGRRHRARRTVPAAAAGRGQRGVQGDGRGNRRHGQVRPAASVVRRQPRALRRCTGLSGMPRRNRVDPWGDLHAVAERGHFTGNRGCVVDEDERVVRHHGSQLWITCRTSFRGWRHPIAAPRRWTPLFFLDDAVALAAGHRPCATCRREDYVAYRDAVTAAAELRSATAGQAARPAAAGRAAPAWSRSRPP